MIRLSWQWLIWLALFAGSAAGASTPADLIAAGKLTTDSQLVPAEGIVPGQKLKLQLEVATDRWFTGGTRIRIPEVPGLAILQTESFAANASEQRNGDTWVVQRWTLDIYPQRAGEFRIPPVTLEVQVNDADAGSVSGAIQAPAVRFEAAVPPALAAVVRRAMAKRPGKRFRVRSHMRYKSAAAPDLDMKSPIRTNNGITAKTSLRTAS